MASKHFNHKIPTHGEKGLFCGGKFLSIEECAAQVYPNASGDAFKSGKTRRVNVDDADWDVAIIGAGCVGGAIARELAKTTAKVILIDKADDVTQGATKGNSGIVHVGYDDEPGTNRAKYCWPGNQKFEQLDKELHFGYVKNGSLVVARGAADEKVLDELLERGHKNGVRGLRILRGDELFRVEPNLDRACTAALQASECGSVTPCETFAWLNAVHDFGWCRRIHDCLG
jgi:glycerol-3-phosphate dehydrogenase